jgi:hypothetical protein
MNLIRLLVYLLSNAIYIEELKPKGRLVKHLTI